MTKNNWLIPSLIIFGVISVILSVIIGFNTEKTSLGSRHIAAIELNLGSVFLLRNGLTHKEILSRKKFVFAKDSIETSIDGDATLEFDSAYRIRIPENSFITVDKESDKIVLIIKRGDLQVESFGKEGSVFISRDGVRWNATDYEMNYKKMADNNQLPDLSPTEEPAPAAGKTMSSDIIQSTLKTHRNSFFKCYTQLLQKDPSTTAHASITFTIEKNGKVYKANVSNTNIQNAQFTSCLIESVKRIEFKGFEGEAITTTFPLKFE